MGVVAMNSLNSYITTLVALGKLIENFDDEERLNELKENLQQIMDVPSARRVLHQLSLIGKEIVDTENQILFHLFSSPSYCHLELDEDTIDYLKNMIFHGMQEAVSPALGLQSIGMFWFNGNMDLIHQIYLSYAINAMLKNFKIFRQRIESCYHFGNQVIVSDLFDLVIELLSIVKQRMIGETGPRIPFLQNSENTIGFT